MKAWFGSIADEEWGTLIHGENRGKAKWNFYRWNPASMGDYEFVNIRVHRVPLLDDLPFTPENLDVANFHYLDEDGEDMDNSEVINDCCCIICMPELYKE